MRNQLRALEQTFCEFYSQFQCTKKETGRQQCFDYKFYFLKISKNNFYFLSLSISLIFYIEKTATIKTDLNTNIETKFVSNSNEFLKWRNYQQPEIS